jgi:predicted N-formylglutamate amidohydrolase
MTYQPYEIINSAAKSQWLVICDHATNVVPDIVNEGDLGIAEADMQRHIAYDIGAKGVAQALGPILQAPVVCSNFSRLVIDPNRGEDDPTLLMKLYDGTIIEANRFADEAEINRRLDAFHRPYHRAVAEMAAALDNPVILSIHSFTPQLKAGPIRPWKIGVLSADDRRFTDPLLARLRCESDLSVGDNQPYRGELPGDAIDRHALQHGRLNALIELRNDLIASQEDQQKWAARLAPFLQDTLKGLSV